MLFVWAILVVCVCGLLPVADFRVDMPKSTHKLVQKIAGGLLGGSDSSGTSGSSGTSASASASSSSSSSSSTGARPTVKVGGTTQVVLTDPLKAIYYVNTSIVAAEYSHTFPLVLDTGSLILWIYNQLCTSSACTQPGVDLFTDAAHVSLSSSFSLSYSGDEVSGVLVAGLDDLVFAVGGAVAGTSSTASGASGASASATPSAATASAGTGLAVRNMTFGLAKNAPSLFEGYNVSGILGAPSSGDRNWIPQLEYAGLIDSQVFGLSLVATNDDVVFLDSAGDEVAGPEHYGGVIVVGSGSIKHKLDFTSSELVFTPVVANSNEYWLIGLTDIAANGDSFAENATVIVDTGTTGFVLPLEQANELHELLFGSDLVSDSNGNYAFPCSSNASFTFQISGHAFEVLAKDFLGKEYTDLSLEGNCASMIQGLDTDDWVFGAAFLSKYYTVFDLDKQRIGFGESRVSRYALRQGAAPASAAASAAASTASDNFAATAAANSTSHSTSHGTSHGAHKHTDEDSGASSLTLTALAVLILYIF